ncbi:hypothetical protein T484DRAFT_1757459 [Baffinella frigidus]|nr:hypothetical protein T484DRAFT_1757459 [Cryptophyta sp. CCMP2293]
MITTRRTTYFNQEVGRMISGPVVPYVDSQATLSQFDQRWNEMSYLACVVHTSTVPALSASVAPSDSHVSPDLMSVSSTRTESDNASDCPDLNMSVSSTRTESDNASEYTLVSVTDAARSEAV